MNAPDLKLQPRWSEDHARAVNDACQRAATWWAEALAAPASPAKYDNGEVRHQWPDQFMATVAFAHAGRLSMAQRAGFAAELKQSLYVMVCSRASANMTLLCFGSDYGPDGFLADVARKHGLSANLFPFKTLMWLDCTPGRVSVVVAQGYGAQRVELPTAA